MFYRGGAIRRPKERYCVTCERYVAQGAAHDQSAEHAVALARRAEWNAALSAFIGPAVAVKTSPAQYRPTSAAACCDKATRRDCVCQARWECQVHGDHCFGSHE